MTALDWILSAVGLIGFILFLGIVGVFVLEVDLLIVIGIAIGLAVYDFWIRPLRKRSQP
ncbi:MAG: hypothetical protein AAGF49_06955 [Pseudomonadota bacterium]